MASEDKTLKVTEEYTADGHLTKITKEHQAGKTWWDRLQLLGVVAIPLVVACATIGFGWWQAHLVDLQHQNDVQIAQANRQNDLKIADDQQQEATLKAYLDDMTTLLLDKQLGSQSPADQVASAEAAVVAQAKTLTVLRRLNAPRKVTVVKFLYEALLIGFYDSTNSFPSRPPANSLFKMKVFTLSGADLRGVDLRGVDLPGIDLRGTDLSGANLDGAHLSGANLTGTVLTGAFLRGSDLSGAYLNGAHLNSAHLDNVDLRVADLSCTTESGGNKVCTDLSGASLLGADLSGANLREAIVTSEQLAKAKSLRGATMPDGSKYP